MSEDLAYASIAEIAGQIERREISSEAIVKAAIERTQQLDPRLNSYITFLPEQALESARVADREIARGNYLGPLHGVPISIKDHIDTAGIPTTAGAKFRLHNLPTQDAPVVRRLKQAGAVLMGKANMNKFAGGDSGDNPDFGRIKTPWNLEFSAGGSSGGSGAMVAAGLVAMSVGTDNGGSIRIPASLCGVVGLKPTFGRVSIDGIFPRAYTFDHAGPLTRSVADAAITLRVLAGHDAGSSTTIRKAVPDYRKELQAPNSSFRIGVDRQFSSFGQPAVLDLYAKAIERFADLGASIVDVTIPAVATFHAVGYGLCPEFSAASGLLWRQHPSEFPPDDTTWQLAGELVPAVDYIRAQQQRRVLQREYVRATRNVDVFACPAYAFERRPFGDYPLVDGRKTTFNDALRYPLPFDILGLPAISLPCGFSDDGFPIGLQLVGRAFDEAMVLRVAYAYEQATEWHSRRPSIK